MHKLRACTTVATGGTDPSAVKGCMQRACALPHVSVPWVPAQAAATPVLCVRLHRVATLSSVLWEELVSCHVAPCVCALLQVRTSLCHLPSGCICISQR